MSVDCFLDTNVFVYQLEGRDARKAAIAQDLIQQGIESGNACISFQVVQECINTALRKALVPLGGHDMRRYLESVLAPLFRVQPSLRLYRASWTYSRGTGSPTTMPSSSRPRWTRGAPPSTAKTCRMDNASTG